MPADRPETPEADEDPIERIVSDVVKRLQVLADAPDAALTCNGLIELIGSRSHTLAILIFSLLNLLPGPPGYSIALGIAIMVFSAMMILHRPMRLWSFLGDRKLPLGLLLKLLEMLARFTSLIARISSPRLSLLTGRAAMPFIGLFGIVMGMAMLVPIPFTNTVPSIGMAIVCVAVLNRDGIAAIVGAVIGFLGLAALILACWAAYMLTMFVGEVIIDLE